MSSKPFPTGRVAGIAGLSAVVLLLCMGVGLPTRLDVPYEPTPAAVVEAMLDLAEVTAGDVVYDLGCGDGRIVIAAVQRGARGVGVDLDPRRIAESKANAKAAGVTATWIEQDLFKTDVREATVVMLYLWPGVNLRLRPKLQGELGPGARVVSHSHDMGDWKPDRSIVVEGRTLHLWTMRQGAGSPEAAFTLAGNCRMKMP